MSTWLRLLCWLRAHRCYIGDIRRLSPEQVECPCNRCGTVLRAPYGIALSARLEQRRAIRAQGDDRG